MEGTTSQKESAVGVYELPGEPAIVINGVPDIISSCGATSLHNAPSTSTVETNGPSSSGLAEWFEGREVRKWFMGRYYSGTVTEYDKESGWYRVLYEKGNSEDLDWRELQEVLLPLDIKFPLKAFAQRIVRKSKKSGKNVAPSQTPQIKKGQQKESRSYFLSDRF